MTTGKGGTGERWFAFVSPKFCIIASPTDLYLGSQLMVMLERAIRGAEVQTRELTTMTHTWSKYVPKWRAMLADYKRNKSKPNPFQEPDPGKFLNACTISELNHPNRYHNPQAEGSAFGGRKEKAQRRHVLSS